MFWIVLVCTLTALDRTETAPIGRVIPVTMLYSTIAKGPTMNKLLGENVVKSAHVTQKIVESVVNKETNTVLHRRTIKGTYILSIARAYQMISNVY